jgi:glutamyl-tRNA reductase
VADLRDVFLYGVDDLERVIDENRRNRREAADEAEAIVELQVARYQDVLAASAHHGHLKRLRAHGDAARDESLHKARQLLAAGQDPADVLQLLAHTLTNRLLHAPTAALRDAALNGDTDVLRAAERLFPELTSSHSVLADAVEHQLHPERFDAHASDSPSEHLTRTDRNDADPAP